MKVYYSKKKEVSEQFNQKEKELKDIQETNEELINLIYKITKYFVHTTHKLLIEDFVGIHPSYAQMNCLRTYKNVFQKYNENQEKINSIQEINNYSQDIQRETDLSNESFEFEKIEKKEMIDIINENNDDENIQLKQNDDIDKIDESFFKNEQDDDYDEDIFKTT